MTEPQVYIGNAEKDAGTNRGWFLGRFMGPDAGVRHTEDLEIKWGIHPAGQVRDGWTTGESRHTTLILIEGRFVLHLATGSHVLSERGDYVVWGPGVDHSWSAEEDSIMLTVRWPSTAA